MTGLLKRSQTTILSTVIITISIGYAPAAMAANDYTNSAHGSNSIGVLRTSTELSSSTRGNNYARGNCAHCHEQHGSIDGGEPAPVDGSPSNFALFTDTNPTSQTTNFCFNCHQSLSSLQSGGITNNDYSTTFGGQSSASTTSIYDAFNPSAGTAHDLTDVQTELVNSFSFASTDNPCGGCHNPHFAEKNNATGASYDPTKAAISRPGQRNNLPDAANNLWGDDTSERMQARATADGGTYRAPFYVGANPANTSTLHEPDGLSGSVGASSPNVTGANTPDYVTFCLDCHSSAVAGTNPARTIPAIPWTAGGATSQHGPANGGGSSAGNQIAPYTTDGSSVTGEATGTNFVLSCLDCHEPHGSQQTNGQYLLRTTVNGTATSFTGTNAWFTFCTTCHILNGTGGGGVPNHSAYGTTTSSCNNANCHGHSGGTQNF